MGGIIAANYPNLYDQVTSKQIGFIGLDNKEYLSVYPAVSELPPASQFGKGVAQVGSSLYVSDGVGWKLVSSLINNIFSATNEKILCDWAGDLAPAAWSPNSSGVTFQLAEKSEIPDGADFDGPVVKILTDADGACNWTSPTFTAKDIGDTGAWTNIRIPIYFPESGYNATTTGESVILDLASDTGFTNRIAINHTSAGNTTNDLAQTVNNDFVRGWSEVVIPIADIAMPTNTTTGATTTSRSGTPDINAIIKLRLQVKRYNPTDTRPIFIGPVRFGSTGKTKIAFSFDDNKISLYSNVLPLLKKFGYVGTLFAMGDFATFDGVTKINMAQLQEMKAAGWTIATHTRNHFNHLTQYKTQQERYNDIMDQVNWAKANGFDWDIFAWPGGGVLADSKDILFNNGIKAGFTYTGPTSAQLLKTSGRIGFADRYCLPRTPLEGTTTRVVTDSETWINFALACGGSIILSGHDFTSAATSATHTNLTEFEGVLQKIKDRERAGLLEVVSLRDIVDSYEYF